MTPERLAEIRQRCELATPGPWCTGSVMFRCRKTHLHTGDDCVYGAEWYEGDEKVYVDRDYTTPQEAYSGLICGTWDRTWDREFGGVKRPADADFIAHARQDLPDALAEIDSLRAEVERLRADSDLLATAVRRACYTNEEGEVDSLTPFELLDQFQDKLTNAYRQLAEIDRLRAENERLRGAGE